MDAGPDATSVPDGRAGCDGGWTVVEALWDGAGAAPVAADVLCDSLRDAICEPLVHCGCDASVVTLCSEAATEACGGSGRWPNGPILDGVTRERIAAGDIVYDNAAAGVLVELVRGVGASCDVDRSLLLYKVIFWAADLGVMYAASPDVYRCDPMVPFTCERGSACLYGGDLSWGCTAGAYGDADCSAIGLCEAHGTRWPRLACAGEECDEGLGEGAHCPGYSRCRFGSSGLVCLGMSEEGEPCAYDRACTTGFCAIPEDGEPLCRTPTARLGEPCAPHVGCIEGVCEEGRCIRPACGSLWAR